MATRMYAHLLAMLSVAATAAPAAAQHYSGHRADCDNSGDRRYEHYCDTRAMGWRGGHAPISVDASPNGGVTVTGWDRDSVDVAVTVHAQAPTMDEARSLAAQVEVSSTGGVLRATGPESRHDHSWWVSYDVSAPAHSDLTLRTLNGPVEVDHVTGVMDLRAENGPLTLDEIGGDVRARLENGPLHVTLSGTSWSGEGLDAETVNGPAVLEVPDGYNADLEAGTVNGPMDIGMPVTVQGRFGSGAQRIHTTLGHGGPTVRVVTTNGPAVLQRR